MDKQAYNGDQATKALRDAMSANDELISKFNSAVSTLKEAFTESGLAVGGKVGEAAANSISDGMGTAFTKDLQTEMENFLNEKVPGLLSEMETFTNATTNAYSAAAQSGGAGR